MEQKSGEGIQKLKKRDGQAGSRRGCLKKVGGWNPLTNYGYKEHHLPYFAYYAHFLRLIPVLKHIYNNYGAQM